MKQIIQLLTLSLLLLPSCLGDSDDHQCCGGCHDRSHRQAQVVTEPVPEAPSLDTPRTSALETSEFKS